MNASRVQSVIMLSVALVLFECVAYGQEPRDEAPKVTVTTVQSKAVTLTQSYVCQIESHHHIKVRAPANGFLEATPIKAGQAVKRGDLLFQLRPLKAKETRTGENEGNMVSVKAPFDGMVDRLSHQRGSLVLKGETLTNLFDNSVMWVYFNVPEKRYFEYMAGAKPYKEDPRVELVLADGSKYPQRGKLNAIGAVFNAGKIPFRADFPNAEGLLRHGQTGTVLISHVQNHAIVIPLQATFQVLDRRYVWVVDKDDIAHQREIMIQNELDDRFVIKKGVGVGDKIVLDGVGRVRDGDKVQH